MSNNLYKIIVLSETQLTIYFSGVFCFILNNTYKIKSYKKKVLTLYKINNYRRFDIFMICRSWQCLQGKISL